MLEYINRNDLIARFDGDLKVKALAWADAYIAQLKAQIVATATPNTPDASATPDPRT